ncbi:phage protein NinX family protein [Enterobacter hormaechei]
MEYSQLSDRDIDALVLQVIYGDQAKDKDIMRAWLRGGFKYTTKPADAWPIIAENKISIYAAILGDSRGEWGAEASFTEHYHFHNNPLRAAMIVFLMMQEKKNG